MKNERLQYIFRKIKEMPNNASEPKLVDSLFTQQIVVDYGHLGKLTISCDWFQQCYVLNFPESGLCATVQYQEQSNSDELDVLALFKVMRLTKTD